MVGTFQNIISTVQLTLTSPYIPTAKIKTLDIFTFLKSPHARHYRTMFCFSFCGETKKFVIFNGFLRQLKLKLEKKNFHQDDK